MKFKVRIENISTAYGLAADDGSKYAFAVSPGKFAVSERKINMFKPGKKASDGLEAQAEDGNPEMLAKKISIKIGSKYTGIFNMPVGEELCADGKLVYTN